MDKQEMLSVGEFTRWSDRADRALERIEGKVDNHGERLTRLETAIENRQKKTRRSASGWGGAAAGIVMLIVEGIHRFWGMK